MTLPVESLFSLFRTEFPLSVENAAMDSLKPSPLFRNFPYLQRAGPSKLLPSFQGQTVSSDLLILRL